MGEEEIWKLKISLEVSSFCSSVSFIEKVFVLISERWMLMPNWKSNMKKDYIVLNVAKNFTAIFDHRFDIIEKHNSGHFETNLRFWIFFPTQQPIFCLFFSTKRRHSKSDVIKFLSLLLNIFLLCHVMILLLEKQI